MSVPRYDYIDLAKGWGILTVVWAHIMLEGWSFQVSYAYHMPLFFFLSGMLFMKKKYTSFCSFVCKRAKRLLLPYAIYSLVTWAVWAVFRYIRHDTVDSYFAPLLQTFIAQGSGTYLVHNSALWFIPCLFVVELIYYAICKLPDWLNVVLCFAACGFSFMMGHCFEDRWWFLLPYNFDAALIALPFYSVGNLLIKHYPHEKIIGMINTHKVWIAALCILSFLVLFVLSQAYGVCSMGSSIYSCSGFVFMSRAYVGIAALLLLALLMSTESFVEYRLAPLYDYLKWCGRNSLDIMCLHIPVKGIVAIFVAYCVHADVNSVGSSFALASVAFVLSMIIVSMTVLIINKWMKLV